MILCGSKIKAVPPGPSRTKFLMQYGGIEL